ncbi:MAG TPA: tyrosine-type recombinase/integrase [Bryobacteraceae bacterium]|jgi:transcriptional regulator with XRE-family HTH domain
MARKKNQRPNGYVHRQREVWYLTYSRDELNDDGVVVRKRRKKKLAATNRDDARKEADRFLDSLVSTASGSITLRQFVDRHFRPDYITKKKISTQGHYKTVLANHVLPAFGDRRIDSINHDAVQWLINQKLESDQMKVPAAARERQQQIKALRDSGKTLREIAQTIGVSRGRVGQILSGTYRPREKKPYSVQTVVHVRNVLSAIFKYAKAKGVYKGDNPCKTVMIGELDSKSREHWLTLEQAKQLIDVLPTPAKELVTLCCTTSMNRAEATALTYGAMNLTDDWVGMLPPRSLEVRRNWYKGNLISVKTRKRRRILPLPVSVVEALQRIKDASEWVEPDDFLFAGPERDKPVNVRNLESRVLKPAAKAVGIPWFGLHDCRRLWVSCANRLGFQIADMLAGAGHSSFGMTLRYSAPQIERRRGGNEQISSLLTGKAETLDTDASVSGSFSTNSALRATPRVPVEDATVIMETRNDGH